MPKIKKFLIIDANSLIHRAYHALPPLTTKKGVLVNAVYGFTSIFLKILRELKPDYIAVCFDVAGGTFRDEIYEDYKAGREEKSQEFYDQFPIIKDLLAAFKVKIFEKRGYEADDIIGTLSRNPKFQIPNSKFMILTGDKDMLQLVDKNTEVELVKKGVSETVTYTPDAVKDEMGFTPEYIADFKALRGDPSDNIPGVKGIGEKTATELIKEFGTIEEIYEKLKTQNSKLKITAQNLKVSERVIKKLLHAKEEAFLSKKLAIIATDVPINVKLDDLKIKEFDMAAVIAIIQELGFKSLMNRLPRTETGSLFGSENRKTGKQENSAGAGYIQPEQKRIRNKKHGKYTLIDSEEAFEKFIERLKKQKIFVIDTETDGLDPITNKLLGMSFSWKAGEGYYFPNPKFQIPNSKQIQNTKYKISSDELRSILENPRIKKVGHNIKFDYKVLKMAGILLNGIEFDSMIASYLLNPGSRSYSLSNLAFSEFGHQMIPITDLIGPKKNQISMREVAVEQVAEYASEDADYTWRLYEKLSKDENLLKLEKVFKKIEMPLVKVLGDMELLGIKIDTKLLNVLSRKLESKIMRSQSKIFELSGEEFNPASPKQLKEILFDKLKLPIDGLNRTKTGISTSAADLEKLKGKHKIIDHILEFREFSKLKNTYTDTLPKLINPATGRVHTDFNQTVTATGRLSSSDPNLQNIPIRTDIGSEIRKAFIAERGYALLSADYSQIELRIVASMARDKKMIRSFKNGEDIHLRTASEIYGIPLGEVSREKRREAKEVNFGILYGLGPRGMAMRAGIPYEKAKNFFVKYFQLYPGIKEYLERLKEKARNKGYTETLMGRRRYFPEINTGHQFLRAQAERAAVNHPIQGTAADLMKLAMIEVDEMIKKRGWEEEVRMLLQVHDELVFEVKDALAEKASAEIKEIMESVVKLDVPVEVHVGKGKNWGECK